MINKELILDMDELIDSVILGVQEGTKVTLTGCGSSMMPFIMENTDKIVLEKIPENKKIKVGEIYLYRRQNGRYAIHRVYKKEKNQVWMVGDSQLFLEKEIPTEHLLAIVTTVIKPDRGIDCLCLKVRFPQIIRMKYRQYCHRYPIIGFFHRTYLRVLEILHVIKRKLGL